MESKNSKQKQKIWAKATHFGGSWKFIILYAIIFTFWVVFNMISLTYLQINPYLFILINLGLSGIATLQAPFILMNQNRIEEIDRLRKENDNLINRKPEIQIKSLEQKMDLLLEAQNKTLFEAQEKQVTLLKEINLKLDTLKHKGF
ncbi:MAG: DUF1003 domain-containing protein [Bacteroidota bacterium]